MWLTPDVTQRKSQCSVGKQIGVTMKIDARNLTCPKPVVLTLEALPKLAAGESLEVVVNDSVALGNLTRLAAEKNCDLTTAASGD